MKILVTGARGMLGHAIRQVFTVAGHDLILTGSIELNVQDIRQVLRYEKKDIDLIIHAAAETDHLSAEFNPLGCYMTNVTGTMNMVELARRLHIPIVYIGTCGIYDGSQESYKESDWPCPLNHYGWSKYYGEQIVRGYSKHYIFRCGWGMGGGPGIDKKFINKVYAHILTGVKQIDAIADVFGSPTYHPDLARTIERFVSAKNAPVFGIYNCGGERASRYEVAYEFVKALGLAGDVIVYPVSYERYHEDHPVYVPYTKCEVLDLAKINKTGLSCMRPWKEALGEYALLWKYITFKGYK